MQFLQQYYTLSPIVLQLIQFSWLCRSQILSATKILTADVDMLWQINLKSMWVSVIEMSAKAVRISYHHTWNVHYGTSLTLC